MIRLVIGLLALIMIGTSQASMNLNGRDLFGKPTRIVALHQTVTQKGPVLVKSKIPKPKLFSGNPHKTFFLSLDDWDYDVVDVDDVITTYRRRDLLKIDVPEEAPLPEHIQWRLFLARQLALLKYREIHG